MKPEFRLYYDANGKVVCYSCSPLDTDNSYIVIDAQTYAEGRPEVIIVNSKITKPNMISNTLKLVPSSNGIGCATDDISIVTSTGKTQNWKLKINEF